VNTSFTYLGMVVRQNHRRNILWEGIMNKIKNSLGKKGKYLSFVGRVTLLKSMLTSLPLFYLSFYNLSIT